MKTRTLATIAVVLLILVAGVGVLYAVRSQVPPTAVSSTPSLTPTATVAIATSTGIAPTPFPSAASVAATWAAACGAVSDFVGNTGTTNGSLVLNSPGRSPLKIVLTSAHSTPGGSIGGYVCASLEAGVPSPIFGGLFPPNTAGFISQGTLPATAAQPAPTGFVLPQACAFVSPPVVEAITTWSVDCGATANRDARGTFGPAFTQQGWTSCGVGLANAAWMKSSTQGTARVVIGIVVSEGSGAPGEYPKLTQSTGGAGAAQRPPECP